MKITKHLGPGEIDFKQDFWGSLCLLFMAISIISIGISFIVYNLGII